MEALLAMRVSMIARRYDAVAGGGFDIFLERVGLG